MVIMSSTLVFLSDDVAVLILHLDVGSFSIPGVNGPEIELESDLVETSELSSRNSGLKGRALSTLVVSSIIGSSLAGSLRPSLASIVTPSREIISF